MNYSKIYNDIIEARKLNTYQDYTECHHILPRCLGGTDNKDNLVNLSAKEHFICHLLLTKMYPKGSNEYYKMCHAFFMMLVTSKDHKGNRYITSKKYVALKESHCIRMSDLQSGKGNSQYGTMWIYNIHTFESKKIDKNIDIPEGWKIGRKMCVPIDKYCKSCNTKLYKNRMYCNIKCRPTLKIKKPEDYIFYNREGEFIELYKIHKSINKPLKIMGFSGAHGEYYVWAKNILTQLLAQQA